MPRTWETSSFCTVFRTPSHMKLGNENFSLSQSKSGQRTGGLLPFARLLPSVYHTCAILYMFAWHLVFGSFLLWKNTKGDVGSEWLEGIGVRQDYSNISYLFVTLVRVVWENCWPNWGQMFAGRSVYVSMFCSCVHFVPDSTEDWYFICLLLFPGS